MYEIIYLELCRLRNKNTNYMYHKNSPLSEQFPKSNIKMEERDQIDTANIQNKYVL
jgi:hypothetical protein